ncbi:MAG: MATE family efflux transporter [Pseudohongiellaceae bacterium]|nr:MATE family efflux transporter [Pseudohongiellaceae bacterium]
MISYHTSGDDIYKMPNAVSQRFSFTQDPIYRTLVRSTVPMIIGLFTLYTFNLVDTFFIGMLGTTPLSAISFTFPITFMILSLAIGLGIGTSAVVARYLGANEHEKAKQASTVANYVAMSLAVILSLIIYLLMDSIFSAMGASAQALGLIRDYLVVWLPASALLVGMTTAMSVLRACGDTKTASIVMATAGLLNALLDPLLIFGWGPIPAFGIKGAAIATLISWLVAITYLFHCLIVKHQLVYPGLPTLSISRTYSKEMLRIGVPASGANMLTPLAAAIMTAIAATYGESAVAAFGVGSRLESIACLIVLALSTTLPPFISQNLGAGRTDRIADAFNLTAKFVLVWQLIVYVALFLLAPSIANSFSSDTQVSDAIKLFIWILPLGYGLQGIIILANSAFNALHKPMAALYLSLLRFFVFYIPFAWLGSETFGLIGFYTGALIGNLAMAWISWRSIQKALRQTPRVEALCEN